MAAASLEKRVAALEAEVGRLKALLETSGKNSDPWFEKVWGSFANDPAHEEAMRLGREYRESLCPKPAKRRRRKR